MIRERTRLAINNPEVRKKWIDKLSKLYGHRIEPGLPNETREEIVKLYKQGYSIRKIAKKLALSPGTVYRVLVKEGAIQLPEDTCPRCFCKMRIYRPTPAVIIYECPHCRFEKRKEIITFKTS